MLINFCNPNQSLAAIQIEGSVLTLFFSQYTEVRDDAFLKYLIDTFNIHQKHGTNFFEKNHSAFYHKESYHLMRFKHEHLDFGVAIDKKLGKLLIDAAKKYQGKSTTALALRKFYEEKEHKGNRQGLSIVARFYKMTEYWKSRHIDLALPIISNRNLKRLQAEFDKMPQASFSTSMQIMNVLNTTTTTFNLSKPSTHSYHERLIGYTCEPINELIREQDAAVSVMFDIFEYSVAAASFGLALLTYIKMYKWLNPGASDIGKLFPPIDYPKVEHKPASEADKLKVQNVFQQLGMQEQILDVKQPLHAAEISSQNFTIITARQTLQLRRCHIFKGAKKYRAMAKLLNTLTANGVHVVELAYPTPKILSGSPYFEISAEAEKLDGWVFFKNIDAVSYYPGLEGLGQTALQVGRMHAVLKKEYGTTAIFPLDTSSPYFQYNAPYFPIDKWESYRNIIRRDPTDNDSKRFVANEKLITESVKYVANNFHLLQDQDDIQNIHFDLNAANFLMTKNKKIIIMDFDGVKLGNVYNDISMLFARAFNVCLGRREITNATLVENILSFFQHYLAGNPTLKFNVNKLIVAAYDRALCNIHASLRFKYDDGDTKWIKSIPLNLERLRQIDFMVKVIQKNDLQKELNASISRPLNQRQASSLWVDTPLPIATGSDEKKQTAANISLRRA